MAAPLTTGGADAATRARSRAAAVSVCSNTALIVL